MQNDINSLEDKIAEEILLISAQQASSKAMRISVALGLSVKVIRDNKIIEIFPDKTEKIIHTLQVKHKVPNIVRGTILKRKII